MKKDFSNKVFTLASLLTLAVSPSAGITSNESRTFIARVNGVTKSSPTRGYYFAKIKIRNGRLVAIKEIKRKDLRKYRKHLKNKNVDEIELFYPSDYKISLTEAEQKKANQNKLYRLKRWNKFIQSAKDKNVLGSDNRLNYLPPEERKKELQRRKRLWDEVSRLYVIGDFYGVLAEAKPLYKYPSHKAMAHFLSGMSAKKFQDYELAEKHFRLAKKFDVKNTDVDFQLGKVLFTQNKLEESYGFFEKSFKSKKRIYRSAYFKGWIRENQQKYPEAKKLYEEAKDLKGIDQETKQAIIIRLAKVSEIIAKNNPLSNIVSLFITRDVAAPLKQALQENDETKNASTIERILERIQNEYRIPSIIPFRIGSMGYYLRYNQNIQYDTNASGENEDLSDFRDSFVSKSQLLYKHLFSTKKGFVHTPELRFTHQYNFEKNIPNISANNQYTIAPAFRNAFTHEWFGQKTQFTFDVETSYSKRNLNSDGDYQFYNKSIKFNLGDYYKFFDFGRTIFKFRYDTRSFFDSTLDSNTSTVFINQFINLPRKHTVSLIGNMDFTTVEDSINNANTYMLRADYIAPSLLYKGDVQAGLTILATDTLDQSDTRGTEIMISPEVEWRRTFNKYFEIALQYYYTNNKSDAEALTFDQHIFSFELELNQN